MIDWATPDVIGSFADKVNASFRKLTEFSHQDPPSIMLDGMRTVVGSERLRAWGNHLRNASRNYDPDYVDDVFLGVNAWAESGPAIVHNTHCNAYHIPEDLWDRVVM